MMLKKTIALMLICALLIPFTSAFAADSEPTIPTIEEILTQYQHKVFTSQTTELALYSSGKTLEQETVESLNNYGYEAYYVTAENYDFLQAQLKTDFAVMGLDPNSSYIITFSGENGQKSRAVTNPWPDQTTPDLGGSEGFDYTFSGNQYRLRYVTTTVAENTLLERKNTYTLTALGRTEQNLDKLLHASLVIAGDTIAKLPVVSIIDLYADLCTDDNYTILSQDDTTLHAATAWTRSLIQVYNQDSATWCTAQVSEYATSVVHGGGMVYNSSLNRHNFENGKEFINTTYSLFYDQETARKEKAVNAFIVGQISYDTTGAIAFYFDNASGDISWNEDGSPLFWHLEPPLGALT